ncbi:MAG: sulfite exporter TauE/SafE family protein [Alphaproteobacteria bacterium]|nr:MAG: sulfite exporter TauE/SafE family protein [Alphaproteobacteria bacterium]
MGAELAGILTGPAFPALALGTALAGLSRGFTGFGTAMIFIPLAAIHLPPVTVVVVMHLIDIWASLLLTRRALGETRIRPVLILIAGVCIGLPLGFIALQNLDPIAFRWLAPALVLAALAALISGWRYRREPGDPLTFAIGIGSGLTGGLVGMVGPPVVLFFLGSAERAVRMRAAFILFLLLATPAGLVVFWLRGALGREALAYGILLAPIFVLCVLAGARLFRMAGERDYRYAAYALVAGAATLSLPIWSG